MQSGVCIVYLYQKEARDKKSGGEGTKWVESFSEP